MHGRKWGSREGRRYYERGKERRRRGMERRVYVKRSRRMEEQEKGWIKRRENGKGRKGKGRVEGKRREKGGNKKRAKLMG